MVARYFYGKSEYVKVERQGRYLMRPDLELTALLRQPVAKATVHAKVAFLFDQHESQEKTIIFKSWKEL